MIHIADKSKCCGCTACETVCPKGCIKLTPDSEGFLYPEVNEDECIKCGKCEKVCPVLNQICPEGTPYAKIIRNKNEDVLMDSTSGGAFTAFASELIKRKNAVVYGASYDADKKVTHTSCTTIEGLHEFRGSKFVQSDLSGVYDEIRNKLMDNETVLFSGTPCQVAGLKKVLDGKYDENLYCIDIVCRGVPSPKLWSEYLKYIESKYKSKVTEVKFRNKTYGYHSSTMFLKFENGREYKKSGRVDPMMRLFTREVCSRPSCSECAFKTEARVSDLTLFDCKKYTQLTGSFDDDKGYTAVLVQSKKGEQLLDWASNNVSVEDVCKPELISACGIMLCGKAQPNIRRSELFEQLGKIPLDQIVQRVCPVSKKDLIIERMKSVLYNTGLIKIARKLKKHENISVK